MKKSLSSAVLISIFAVFSSAYGQQTGRAMQKVYLDLGAGSASHKGGFSDIGVHFVLKNNWIATLSHHATSEEPKNLPADYDAGYTILLMIPISNPTPTVNINMTSLTAGKLLPIGRKTWVAAEAGVSLVSGQKATYTRQQVDQFYFLIVGGTTSNYQTSLEKKTTAGAMMRADLNWAFCKVAGLGFGAHANLNSIQSTAGFEFKLTVGWMNYKKKDKHSSPRAK